MYQKKIKYSIENHTIVLNAYIYTYILYRRPRYTMNTYYINSYHHIYNT